MSDMNVDYLPDGWLSQEEADLLIGYAGQTEGDIVEVGSFKGRSTVLLAGLGRRVHAIDPWEDYMGYKGKDTLDEFLANTSGFGRITFADQFQNPAPFLNRKFDVVPHRYRVEGMEPIPAGFVFLDGDHEYEGTLAQIRYAISCNPTFIATHDYRPNGGANPGVAKACHELLGTEPIAVAGSMAIWNKWA